MLVYISCFQCWLDALSFLNIALEGARPYVMTQNSRCNTAVEGSAVELLCGTDAIDSEFLQLFHPCRRPCGFFVVVRTFHTSRVWKMSYVLLQRNGLSLTAFRP